MKNRKIIGRAHELGLRLHAAGLLPAHARRFIIDSGYPDGVVTIYWECFGDEEFLSELIDELLKMNYGKVPIP
jgi:hypothetical protein